MTRLGIDQLSVRYRTGRRTLTAVDGVSLDVPEDTVVGLVGESGSGKSTLARALVGLAPVSGGRILLDGTDVTRSRARRRAVTRDIQLVFQDPYTSLDPRMTVGASIVEALTARGGTRRAEAAGETGRLLELVGLDPDVTAVRPRQLSGGQRQRVALVRALAARPRLLVADEITSALDVSLQGAILNLVNDLRARLGFSVLFISHNLAAVRYVSDIIAVMYLGQIVEVAATDDLVRAPRHPYTRTLLDAIPSLDGALGDPGDGSAADSEPPDPHHPPAGCRFHTRCPVGPLARSDRNVCRQQDPAAEAAARPHRAACHFAMDTTA